MRSPARTILVALLTLAVTFGLATVDHSATTPETIHGLTSTTVQGLDTTETTTGWECADQGNQQCGKGTDGGPVEHPSADGGTHHRCPTTIAHTPALVVNTLGVYVCDYNRTV